MLSKSCALLCQISYLRLTVRFYNRQVPVALGKHGEDQVNFIKSSLDNNVTNWNEFKNNIISKQGNINNVNINGVLLKIMVNNKKFDAARSFVNHLKSTNDNLSLGSINGFLVFYHGMGKENELSSYDKQFILDIYKKLYDTYTVLDSTTCENLLHCLCTINEWEKALKVLDDICLSNVPTHSAYSTLIATLFKNNKKEKALEMIHISHSKRRPLQDNAYEAWIDYILREYKDKKNISNCMDEICTHISKSFALITINTAKKLKDIYNTLGRNAQFTKLKKTNGQCICCKQTLQCLKLSEEEFQVLRQNVKEKLIVGSDMFLKTSPEELNRFLQFIEKTAPYDIVLDALNISYAVGKGSSSQRILALNNVTDYFLEKNKKVLILGRKHMLNWDKVNLKRVLDKTHSFFIDNISQDDPYFITAAIMSGSHADIVSKDLLRGHIFLLKEERLRILFQRWQWQHQWMVFMGFTKKIHIQPPLPFTPWAQTINNSWHIPYKSDTASGPSEINDGIPNLSTWLCIAPQFAKFY